MPSLIGKPIPEVLAMLSKAEVNVRTLPSHILSHNEANIPTDVVIAQIPAPGVCIKPGHTVFITIAEKQPRPPAPYLVGLKDHEIVEKTQQLGLKVKLYYLAHSQAAGTCIAQLPEAEQEMPDNTMIVYISAPQSPIVLFPNFKAQNVEDVIEFLQEYAIPYQLHSKVPALAGHSCSECIIYDQKPAPGILINSQKALTVHIYITHELLSSAD